MLRIIKCKAADILHLFQSPPAELMLSACPVFMANPLLIQQK
ncbi:hypothetical protein YPPY64_2226 [Yersinia pestis PY-64]|nr:hypothetical protein YPPY05_2142 [Yersinia pestis PY-05]EIS44372.1 hypothetical protein YPPY60_2180 [Yersinia pestis PY-60]EIS62636.1 hypothetical protein YPPY64_2226 [Yersinia pestis PY-64]EIT59260.1 hypothetical protein YPPY103_2295 [Yersinia pestis PY-103]